MVGWASTPSGSSLCKLAVTKKMLMEEHKDASAQADSFLILACDQGVHTVIDATEGGMIHPGCDTIFGGETVRDDFITEYCSLCGECVIEKTGGLCPITLCSKWLLNGPCGGARDGKCEVNPDQDCGWQLIYDRLKSIGKLEWLKEYKEPKNFALWSRPRYLNLGPGKPAHYHSQAGVRDIEMP